MAQSKPSIVIVGAGIAGLILAQGLRRQNIDFKIYEKKNKVHQEQGHRFRVQPSGIDAIRTTVPPWLFDLFIKTCAVSLENIVTFYNAHDLEILEEHPIPLHNGLEALPIDRSWARMLLLLGIEGDIVWGKEAASFEVESDRVRLDFTDQTSVYGSFLVGADGMRSRIRNQLQPERRFLKLDRQMIWGRAPYKANLPKELMRFFAALDGSKNCIAEPMIWRCSVKEESGGALPDFDSYVYWTFNGPISSRPLRNKDEIATYIREGTRDWHPALRSIYEDADHRLSVASQIFSSAPDIGRWESGRVTLIGDAAHPMSPMGGVGATNAIITAADLSQTIGQHGINKGEISAFEDRMRERSKKAIEFSLVNGQKLWSGNTVEEYMKQESVAL